MNSAIVKLSKVIRVHYGAALKEADREQSGAHHVYGSSGVVGRHSESLFEYPSIVIGRKGSVGAVTYAPALSPQALRKYGVKLQANNGRNALQDAYEEVLDLAHYLKQRLVEERSRGGGGDK